LVRFFDHAGQELGMIERNTFHYEQTLVVNKGLIEPPIRAFSIDSETEFGIWEISTIPCALMLS
jgi:hypothetical protein